MPSFFDKIFKKDKAEGKKDAPQTSSEAAAAPAVTAAVPASPTPPAAAAASDVVVAAPRAASPAITVAVPPVGGDASRSGSSHPTPLVNTSFAREDSSSSHLAMVPPSGSPPVKFVMPPPRGGIKILVPPPRGPVMMMPPGATPPFHPMMHHHHHNFQPHHFHGFPMPGMPPGGPGMVMMHPPTPGSGNLTPQLITPNEAAATAAAIAAVQQAMRNSSAPAESAPPVTVAPPSETTAPAAASESPAPAQPPPSQLAENTTAQPAPSPVAAPPQQQQQQPGGPQSAALVPSPSHPSPQLFAAQRSQEVDVSASDSDDIQFDEESDDRESTQRAAATGNSVDGKSATAAPPMTVATGSSGVVVAAPLVLTTTTESPLRQAQSPKQVAEGGAARFVNSISKLDSSQSSMRLRSTSDSDTAAAAVVGAEAAATDGKQLLAASSTPGRRDLPHGPPSPTRSVGGLGTTADTHASSKAVREATTTKPASPPASSMTVLSAQAKPLASTTTPTAKQRIADLFMSILCPQQYFGRVVRVREVRAVDGGGESLSESSQSRRYQLGNKITVATKNRDARYFYPLIRFGSADMASTPSNGSTVGGCNTATSEQRTPIDLYELVPGTMTFAHSEAEVDSVLHTTAADCCYVLSKAAIVLRSGGTAAAEDGATGSRATHFASLTACWHAFESDASQDCCPVHGVPLELFDAVSKELVCALCLAKFPNQRKQEVTVLSEITREPMLGHVCHVLAGRASEASRSLKRLVQQQQRALQVCERQKASIDQQFDYVIAALEAKRKELKMAAATPFHDAASALSMRILSIAEEEEIMRAAAAHACSKSPERLKPLQLATVAHALAVAEQSPFDVGGSSSPAVVPTIPTPQQVALHKVLEAVQRASFSASISQTETAPSNDAAAAPRIGSPLRAVRTPRRPRTPVRFTSPVRGSSPLQHQQPTSPTRAGSSSKQRSRGLMASPGSEARRTPRGVRTRGDRPLETQPGEDGTSLFNFPLHDLLQRASTVTWTVKIVDSGDWVGVGVAVGAPVSSWDATPSHDLNHLWIVPSRSPRTLVLRVTANNGIAKLTVQDRRGKQLDDGRIAHWSTSRACHPQVTFGGRWGRVVLTKLPEVLL